MRVLRHAAHCMLHTAKSREVHVTCILTPYLSELSSHADPTDSSTKAHTAKRLSGRNTHLSKILIDSCRVWHGSSGLSVGASGGMMRSLLSSCSGFSVTGTEAVPLAFLGVEIEVTFLGVRLLDYRFSHHESTYSSGPPIFQWRECLYMTLSPVVFAYSTAVRYTASKVYRCSNGSSSTMEDYGC
jgi:hypothetical protein